MDSKPPLRMRGPWTEGSLEQARSHVASMFGYTIQNDELLREALNVDEVVDGRGRINSQCNNRLAHVGDAVLTTISRVHAYHLGLTTEEADLERDRLLSNDHLIKVGEGGKLHEHINRRFSAQKMGRMKVADTVEAVFGAVFLDSGLDVRVVGAGMDLLKLLPTETKLGDEAEASA